MNENMNAWGILRKLSWEDVLLILGVLVLALLVVAIIRWAIRHLAEKAPARLRLFILRLLPISRLLIGMIAVVVIVPILIEPKFQNVVVLIASVGVAVAFAFKDYASCLVAGLVTVLENTYQPGDWIEIDGTYGEVKSIGLRAVCIVTPDDTEVSIPHLRLWSSSIFNSSSGNRSLLCVADFYLHPEHDASLARRRLAEVAETSSYRKLGAPVVVIVFEKPWGTHYRLKAYVKESREQFLFITDLTVRGKEMLRSIGVRFAQAVYAETKN
ncbi:MAG: mechanosensitive ion channel domain-containing protein [Candidatus Omnitrophota bacterium]